jgi:FKBP-type peptidyl-prolyl cis-trans isomerase FklB
MKTPLLLCGLILIAQPLCAKNITTKNTDAEKLGYSFGYLMGKNYIDSMKKVDLDSFQTGLRAAIAGETPSLSEEEMVRALAQFKRQNEAQELIELKQKADLNQKAGDAFLIENAKKSDVKVTKTGLQYFIEKSGQGKSPKKDGVVKVHYEGRLIDGTVFDSSIARDQPVEFRLDQVIQGWTEGLQLMKEGAKYRFFIPSNLAYGQIGSGDIIEPNTTLIFDVELLKVIQ